MASPPPTSTSPTSSPPMALPPPTSTPPTSSPPPPHTTSSPPSAAAFPNSPPTSTSPPPPTPSNNDPPPPNNPPPLPPPNSPSPPSHTPESSPPPPTNKPPRNSPPPPNPATPSVPLQAPPPPNSPPRSPSPPPPLISIPPPPPCATSSPPPNSPPRSPPPPPSTTSSPPFFSSPSLNPPGSSRSSSGHGLDTGGITATVVVSSLLFLGIVGIIVRYALKREKKASGKNGGRIKLSSVGSSTRSGSNLLKMQKSPPNNESGLGSSKPVFSYQELVDATNAFSAQNLLAEGGFGSVYKGILADGRDVAIKRLRDGGRQGEREFRTEVEIVSRIHHRHLVSLVGYCISGERRLLVHDYLPNNDLYFHLHGEGRPVMDWATRVKIAAGAARGIAYLHEACNPRIIHRDITSSNILLDNNFEAQVSNFRLAKSDKDARTHITTRVMGTLGYLAPEYGSTSKLTEKSDVYSFGVVLLELITGRKPIDISQPLGDKSLVKWARPLLSHALETKEFGKLTDPRLNGNFVDGEMFQVVEAAAACVRHSSVMRPAMSEVVKAFDNMVPSDLNNGMKIGESQIFNSADQSKEIGLLRRMASGGPHSSTDFF